MSKLPAMPLDDAYWDTPVTIDLRLAMDLYQALGYIDGWDDSVLSAADRIVAAMDIADDTYPTPTP